MREPNEGDNVTILQTVATRSVRLGRSQFRDTWVHRLPITGFIYDRVVGAMDIPEETSFRGVTIAIAQADRTITPTLLTGDYERTELDVFEALIEPGMTVIDVGANCGVHSALAAKHAGPGGAVIAVEAVPANVELLTRTIERNEISEIATIVAKAASNSTDPVRIYLDGENSGTHSVGNRSSTFVDVPATPIDLLVSKTDVQRVDVLKIDVEGFEEQVLEGARTTLTVYNPIVFAEFDRDMITAAGGSPEAVAAFLSAHGSIYLIDERTQVITEISPEVLVSHKEGTAGFMACNVIVVPPARAAWFSAAVPVGKRSG